MSLNLKPLGDRLIIKPLEQEEVTSGGIVLPETAKEKPQKGEVVAAGPGARAMKTESASRWMFQSAIWSCSPSTPARRSSSMATNI